MIFAIILGAFGAHFLKAKISENLIEAYKTGVLYHLIHALALFVIGATQKTLNSVLNKAKFFLFLGIILFSGSLYLLSIKELIEFPSLFRFVGKLTPIGGVSFIVGWIFIFLSLKDKS
ncbi:MAG: DUF423 domain-containing protein [Bacteroidota bacterium]